MENMYDDFIDEPNDSQSLLPVEKPATGKTATSSGTSPVPKEILTAYEAINSAIKRVDDAIVSLSEATRKAESINTEVELKEFKNTINGKVAEIKGRMLREVTESIKDLGKQQAALQRKGALDDAQSVIIAGKKRSYQQTVANKETQLDSIMKKLTHLLDNIGNKIRAAQYDAQRPAGEAENEKAEEQMLRQELQEMELVDEREGELIQNIHRDVAEVLAMMGLMAEEVHANQETINRIEANVKAADDDVEAGVEHLKKAEKHHKCSKKCLIIWGVIIAVIAIIVISVLSTIFK
ncbi:Qa-SNARE 1 [Giardia duodenalis]|uniref:Qa-SNARE 1 n=2 Tax=Giardia intestinalis TaxID=5741 RepID=E2RTQ4_GIAIC|nr:Qa-SNARE 1 [Giardia intestinalis]AAK97079.1 syntaxin-like protein 1 [Giardia intestinalis]KAE8303537.1 Qa-SNARE 1 [Giardia intestinalis]|eukprot:XP_001708355.1 Syntaxin-like protein 1 [Giardia lamblia ATCC 50803]